MFGGGAHHTVPPMTARVEATAGGREVHRLVEQRSVPGHFPAYSSATRIRVRVPVPVPPLEVYPYGPPWLNDGPAMSRWAQETPSSMNSLRKTPAESMPPQRSPATLAMSATDESRPERSSSGNGMAQEASPSAPAASTMSSRASSLPM